MSIKCQSILRDRRGRLAVQVASVSADLPSRKTIPEHYHPEDQLIFASRGVMTVSTKRGIWVIPPMRAMWIPAGTPHSVRMSGPVSMRTLYFLPGLVRPLPAAGCFVVNVSPLLKELILHACSCAPLDRRVPTQRRVIAILADQLKAAPSVPLQLPYPSDPRGLRVTRALEADPAESGSLDHLSRGSGASKRTIERIFLAETKMSFRQWRQQYRLLHAMQTLASGEKVTTAALDAGYSSPSAFIAIFRRQFGATPARYFKAA